MLMEYWWTRLRGRRRSWRRGSQRRRRLLMENWRTRLRGRRRSRRWRRGSQRRRLLMEHWRTRLRHLRNSSRRRCRRRWATVFEAEPAFVPARRRGRRHRRLAGRGRKRDLRLGLALAAVFIRRPTLAAPIRGRLLLLRLRLPGHHRRCGQGDRRA